MTVDIEDHPGIGRRYNARTIPMLLMFKDGHIQDTQIDLVGRPRLAEMIDKAL